MRKTVYFCLIYMLSIMYAFPQNGDQEGGGRFIKRIEYNIFDWGPYNLESKTSNEKKLLDKFNAPVEFVFYPFFELPKSPLAFRIFRDSIDNIYVFEYKSFKNFTTGENDEIVNRSFTISDQFAEKMYEKMVSLIDNIKAKGTQFNIIHGYEVTFRVVVEDEVWSLKIHMPRGNARKMSDLCWQILDDADKDKLNEASYIKILDSFEFERQKPND